MAWAIRYNVTTACYILNQVLKHCSMIAVPANMIYFSTYTQLRQSTSPTLQNAYLTQPLTAGFVSRILAASLLSPIELVRTRLQASTGTDALRAAVSSTTAMMQSGGIRSLWRGLGPTLWRDAPFSSIYWFGYEAIRSKWMSQTDLSAWQQSFVAGCISGSLAAWLTQPFDVAKTQQQIAITVAPSSTAFTPPPRQPSMVNTLKQIFKAKGGTSGLWRGAVPRIAKIGPSCGLMISSFEELQRFFAEM